MAPDTKRRHLQRSPRSSIFKGNIHSLPVSVTDKALAAYSGHKEQDCSFAAVANPHHSAESLDTTILCSQWLIELVFLED